MLNQEYTVPLAKIFSIMELVAASVIVSPTMAIREAAQTLAELVVQKSKLSTSGAGTGGEKHFDCFLDAHEKITGTDTGVFDVTFDEIPCKESSLTAIVLEPNNAGYVKVLFAGGTTGVAAADITVGGVKYSMYKNSGATWAASLQGSTQGGVQFDVTFADGSVKTLYDCFSSQWPATNMGEQCSSGN